MEIKDLNGTFDNLLANSRNIFPSKVVPNPKCIFEMLSEAMWLEHKKVKPSKNAFFDNFPANVWNILPRKVVWNPKMIFGMQSEVMFDERKST